MDSVETRDTIQLMTHCSDSNESSEVSDKDVPIDNQFPVCISFKTLALVAATCQIFALIFCLTWSIKFNFYESTATHCHVSNFLPSVSATLQFTPQKDIWITAIGIVSGGRYFIAYFYYKLVYYSKSLFVLHCLEITALLGLSVVDSLKYFDFHAISVGIFLFTTVAHEFLVCFDFVRANKLVLSEQTSFNIEKTKSFKTKVTIINFITLSAALYLYYLHNITCIAGIYSMFSALEYFVILFNIIYHLQAYQDLGDYMIVVMSQEIYTKKSSRKIV